MPQARQTYGRSARDRKRRKARPQGKPAETSKTPTAPQSARPATSSVTWKAAPAARPSSASISIRPEDYRYVYGDLKRIAVLATSIFAILIILSFVLNR